MMTLLFVVCAVLYVRATMPDYGGADEPLDSIKAFEDDAK